VILSAAPKRGLQFPRRLDQLVSLGIVTTDPQIVRRQRCVNIGGFATGASALSHLVFNSIHDFYGLAVVNGYNLIVICAAGLIPLLHRFGQNVGAITLILLVLVVHSCVVWSFGLESDLQVYFVLGGVVLFLFGLQNWRLSFFFFGLFVAA
jgi:adenylate cyclase